MDSAFGFVDNERILVINFIILLFLNTGFKSSTIESPHGLISTGSAGKYDSTVSSLKYGNANISLALDRLSIHVTVFEIMSISYLLIVSIFRIPVRFFNSSISRDLNPTFFNRPSIFSSQSFL